MRFRWRTDVRYVVLPALEFAVGSGFGVVCMLRPSHSKDFSQVSKLSSLKGKQYQYFLRPQSLMVALSHL